MHSSHTLLVNHRHSFIFHWSTLPTTHCLVGSCRSWALSPSTRRWRRWLTHSAAGCHSRRGGHYMVAHSSTVIIWKRYFLLIHTLEEGCIYLNLIYENVWTFKTLNMSLFWLRTLKSRCAIIWQYSNWLMKMRDLTLIESFLFLNIQYYWRSYQWISFILLEIISFSICM